MGGMSGMNYSDGIWSTSSSRASSCVTCACRTPQTPARKFAACLGMPALWPGGLSMNPSTAPHRPAPTAGTCSTPSHCLATWQPHTRGFAHPSAIFRSQTQRWRRLSSGHRPASPAPCSSCRKTSARMIRDALRRRMPHGDVCRGPLLNRGLKALADGPRHPLAPR